MSALIEACARIAHEANRAFCIAVGDDSQVSWDAAPDWQKDSAYNGVLGVINGDTPEQSHVTWSNEKYANGWTYGEVKDPEAKTHPCLVPYDQLPKVQQDKDHLYVAVVKAMASALGQNDAA